MLPGHRLPTVRETALVQAKPRELQGLPGEPGALRPSQLAARKASPRAGV